MQGLVENQPQFNLGIITVGQAFEVKTVYPGKPVVTFNALLVDKSKLQLVFLTWDRVAKVERTVHVDIEDVVSDYVRIEVLK